MKWILCLLSMLNSRTDQKKLAIAYESNPCLQTVYSKIQDKRDFKRSLSHVFAGRTHPRLSVTHFNEMITSGDPVRVLKYRLLLYLVNKYVVIIIYYARRLLTTTTTMISRRGL